jgi:MFS family permease
MFFNFLEASLPALVSRIAPKNRKGSAMGVYSCAQFLGIFSGGALGGYLLQTLGIWGIGVSCLIFALIGWINIRNVEYLSSDNQSEYLNIANS